MKRSNINAVTDVTDSLYIGVTHARVRAYTGYKGEPVTSVTTRETRARIIRARKIRRGVR
ncbi:MAG: hypothetical protein HQL44_09750 [Alphaproteobacteria bacterium]|nr:hypothetical protein [Alphaproteobacteria bacterium]